MQRDKCWNIHRSIHQALTPFNGPSKRIRFNHLFFVATAESMRFYASNKTQFFFLNPCVRHKSREIWVWDRRGGPSLFIRSIRRQIFIGCVRNRVEEKDIGLYVQVSLTVRLFFFLILRFRVLDRVLKELCEFSGLNLSHLKIDLL